MSPTQRRNFANYCNAIQLTFPVTKCWANSWRSNPAPKMPVRFLRRGSPPPPRLETATLRLKWKGFSRSSSIHGISHALYIHFQFVRSLHSAILSWLRNALMSNIRLPLFPLNVVLLPGADLPLHIFEPRYRQMVRDCLDQKSEFGMLLALESGIAGTGCTAEILEVAKKYPDGRMDILTVGRAPFRVVELFNENPLLEGAVDYLDDRQSLPSPQTRDSLIELYDTCHTLLFDDYPRDAASEDAQDHLSYVIASKLPMDLLWKQRILELRTEVERQERLLAYLRDWAPHLEKVESAQRRAAGNGSGLN